MTLHDRIMALRGSRYWQDEYLSGYEQGRFEAAQLAKEADELIEECECALSDAVELHGSMHALKVLNKIRKYKEGNQ